MRDETRVSKDTRVLRLIQNGQITDKKWADLTEIMHLKTLLLRGTKQRVSLGTLHTSGTATGINYEVAN